MNPLLAFVPKEILATLLIVSVITGGIQTWRIGNLKDDNARFEVAVELCASTNETNTATIAELTGVNAQCVEERRSDERQHEQAVTAWTIERELLKVKANDEAEKIVEVFREPTCADFAKVNITDICPGMVDGLRRRAEGINRNEN